LAKVGNLDITEEEFDIQFSSAMERVDPERKAMFSNPHGRRQFLNMLVDQKLWVNWALDQGLDKDPLMQTYFQMARDQILLRQTYQVNAEHATPTETEVRKFYDANPERFKGPAKVRPRVILLSDSTDAKRVLAQLKAGADFAKLAKEKSKDEKTAARGGDLGMLVQGEALPEPVGGSQELASVLFSLKSGGLSDVIKTAQGYEIIKIEERIEPELLPFDSVKQRLEQGLANERLSQIRSEVFKEIQQKYPVEFMIEDSSVSATKSVAPPQVASTPEELFQAAMNSKDSRQRIGIYEELLKKFPESKYAAQAQFMIGFVYSEELKDYPKAEEAFKTVIEKYGDSDLVDSAKWMMTNMRNESKKVSTLEDVKRKVRESQESPGSAESGESQK